MIHFKKVLTPRITPQVIIFDPTQYIGVIIMASVNIEQRKSKSGKITFRAKVRLTKKGNILEEQSQTFTNKKLAVLWSEKMRLSLDEKYSKIKAGVYREEEEYREATVGELISLYLNDYFTQEEDKRIKQLKIELGEKYKEVRSTSKIIGRTKKYVLTALLHYKISSIIASNLRASDLVEHCQFRLNEPSNPKPQTVYHDVTYLRSVMKVAKPFYKINANLTYHDEAIPLLLDYELIGRSGNRNDKRPTEEQLDLMREGLRKRQSHRTSTTPYLDILDISILTAMRISEITSITWEDFNYEKKTLTIRNRKSPSNKIGNDSIIPLLGDSAEIIKRQPKSEDKDKALLIFPHNSRTVTAGWQRVRKALDLGDIRYHDIRRHAASSLIELGVPLHIVSLITGHRNINILHNIYQKLDMENFDINDFTPVMTKKNR
ncbi:MAG: integrase [Cognaticolwellia sp.]|jgi:integrase